MIRQLSNYTPRASLLLTKADFLSGEELAEVTSHVEKQLRQNFSGAPAIFPYSIRPGYERLRSALEDSVLRKAVAARQAEQEAVLRHKTVSLGRECAGLLHLALRSAETRDSERDSLRLLSLKEEHSAGTKLQLKLIARHSITGARTEAAQILEPHQGELEDRLRRGFDVTFAQWPTSLAKLITEFQEWMEHSLRDELALISNQETPALLEAVSKTQERMERVLTSFQEQLAEHVVRAFGVRIEFSSVRLEVEPPQTPDIRVGRVFDRNWELLGPLIPMKLLRRPIRDHLICRKLPDEIYKNLSRLTSQWEEIIAKSIRSLNKAAELSLDELVATINRLLSCSEQEAPAIRADLHDLKTSLEEIRLSRANSGA